MSGWVLAPLLCVVQRGTLGLPTIGAVRPTRALHTADRPMPSDTYSPGAVILSQRRQAMQSMLRMQAYLSPHFVAGVGRFEDVKYFSFGAGPALRPTDAEATVATCL